VVVWAWVIDEERHFRMEMKHEEENMFLKEIALDIPDPAIRRNLKIEYYLLSLRNGFLRMSLPI